MHSGGAPLTIGDEDKGQMGRDTEVGDGGTSPVLDLEGEVITAVVSSSASLNQDERVRMCAASVALTGRGY